MPGPRLTIEEREEIALGIVERETFESIAVRIGRHKSTVSREVARNRGDRPRYRATTAQKAADARAARPKVMRLVASPALAAEVTVGLEQRWSPEQIANRLRIDHPDEPHWWVCHETIYQSLYLQGRGGLRAELYTALRTGRARRRTKGPKPGRGSRGKLVGMVNISERPAEADDRAVPGHWEGDLIIGRSGRSQIGTIVERTTRLTLLVALPDNRRAETVRDAITTQIQRLPGELVRSLTWDQGKEMAEHAQFSIDTGIEVFFCDPHAPGQRGTNEHTNGLLRQYYPRGMELGQLTQDDLDAVAAELNGRPRQTLGWMTPSEKFNELVATAA